MTRPADIARASEGGLASLQSAIDDGDIQAAFEAAGELRRDLFDLRMTDSASLGREMRYARVREMQDDRRWTVEDMLVAALSGIPEGAISAMLYVYGPHVEGGDLERSAWYCRAPLAKRVMWLESEKLMALSD